MIMWLCLLFGLGVCLYAILKWTWEDFYLGVEDEEYPDVIKEEKEYEQSYRDYLEVTHGDPNWIGE